MAPPFDAQPSDNNSVLAVVVARLDDLIKRQAADTKQLAEAIDSLRREFSASRSDMVARGEWMQRNEAVDVRFQEQGREIGSLRTTHVADVESLRREFAPKHTPAWSVVAAVAALVSVAIVLVSYIAV